MEQDNFFSGGGGHPPRNLPGPESSAGRQYRIVYADGKVDFINAPNKNKALKLVIQGKEIKSIEVFNKGNLNILRGLFKKG